MKKKTKFFLEEIRELKHGKYRQYLEKGKDMDKRRILSLLIDMYMDFCGTSAGYRTVVYDLGEAVFDLYKEDEESEFTSDKYFNDVMHLLNPEFTEEHKKYTRYSDTPEEENYPSYCMNILEEYAANEEECATICYGLNCWLNEIKKMNCRWNKRRKKKKLIEKPNIQISVTLTPELRLEQALKQNENEIAPETVSYLTIVGRLTKADLEYIRENMCDTNTLQVLDLSNASMKCNRIQDETFSNCIGLTSIIIPNSVTEIGYYAFYGCIGLTSIIIPNSVTEIECGAFSGCTELNDITVHPDNTVYASDNGVLFNKDKTKLILYPAKRQGDYVIPASVTEFECKIFSKFTRLNGITIHPDNTVFTSENGILFNKNKTKLILYPVKRQGDYIIPDSVIEIECSAFEGCIELTSVTIPESVTKIGDNAFSGCTGLTSVVIPASVIEIGLCAFSDCTGLISVTIPDSVTEIKLGTFSGCIGLTSVVPIRFLGLEF